MKLKIGDQLIGKKQRQRLNEDITSSEVRLISEDGEQLGVVSIEVALEKAIEAGLDLIEVGPNTKPPVCKILDYGKLKYEEKKKQQLSKKKQHVIKVKEIRLRPRIDDHDLMTKLNHVRKFLHDGAKLKVTLMFRGREMARVDLGKLVMEKVLEELSDVAEVEKDIPLEGRRMSMILNAKQECQMPKMKTRRGAAKRFKVTGSGRIKRNKANHRHMLIRRSNKAKRKMRQSGIVSSADRKLVKAMLGI